MSLPRLFVAVLAASAFSALIACEASAPGHQDASSRTTDVGDAPAPSTEHGEHRFVVAEFEVQVDSAHQRVDVTMLDPSVWWSPAPEVAPRVAAMPNYCELRNTAGAPETVGLDALPDSVFFTPGECGLPLTVPFVVTGAFCFDATLTSYFTDLTLANPMGEVLQVVPSVGHDGYTYGATGGLVGVDPGTLTGPIERRPTDTTGGLFGFSDLAPGETATTQWVFQNRPGTFRFRGRLIAEIVEQCNGRDDDCDGIVDEAAGCANLGEPCTLNPDCASGNCNAGVCDDDTCSDGVRNGTESDVDCGGVCATRCAYGDLCNTDSDCASALCGAANTCVNFRQPGADEVIVSELHIIPAGAADDEWVELYNTTSETLDLGGCVLSDEGTDSHQLVGELTVGPGETFVVARSPSAANAGQYQYGNFFLGNAGDEVLLTCGGALVDRVAYPAGVAVSGRALQLDPGSLDSGANDDLANFCVNTQDAYTPGDFGTPGAANRSCDLTIDNCRLSDPVVDFDAIEGAAFTVSGQLESLGWTDQNPGLDPSSRVVAEVGIGPFGEDPSVDDSNWTFVAATGDNAFADSTADQYSGVLTAPATVGAPYKLAFRVSGDRGATRTYCDLDQGFGRDGAEDGFALLDTPTMTVVSATRGPIAGEVRVTEFMARSVAGADLGEWIELANVTGEDLTLEGCVLSDDGTDSHTLSRPLIVPANGLVVLANNSDPVNNHGLSVDYTYSGFTLGNGADEIVLSCGGAEIDRVEYVSSGTPSASQIRIDVSTPGVSAQRIPNADAYLAVHGALWRTWCRTLPSNTYGGAGKVGTPGQPNPPCATLTGCNLQFPATLSEVAPSSSHAVYGQVMTSELTGLTRQVDRSPTLRVQAGIGPDGSDPSASTSAWLFRDAEPTSAWNDLSGAGDIDEYTVDIVAPATPNAVRRYAFRASDNGGATWTYCDLGDVASEGSRDGFDASNVGVLSTPTTYTIDYCVLDRPFGLAADPGLTVPFYGQVYIAGLTDAGGDVFSRPSTISVEVGYAPQSTPVALVDWTWSAAAPYRNNAGTGGGAGNNWEFEGAVTVPPSAVGPIDVLYRVSGDGGANWVYCDQTGLSFSSPGVLFPIAYTPTWGRYQAPKDNYFDPSNDNTTAPAGTTRTFYGRVYAPGLTDRTGQFQETHIEFEAEFGYGPAGSLPQTDPTAWTWTAGTLNPGYSDVGEINNNEWQATIVVPAAGTYRIGWRFRGSSVQPWIYADQTGVPYGDNPGDVMNLIAQPLTLSDCPSDVLISEVIETSGANGAIEVWNCGSNAIGLSELSFTYRRDGSAGTTPRTIEFASFSGLSPALGRNEVLVFCYPGFFLAAAAECDAYLPTALVSEFDGDDYFQLNNDRIPGSFLSPAPPADTLGYFPGGFAGLAFDTWRNMTLERDTCLRDNDYNNYFETDVYHAIYPVNTNRSLGLPPTGLTCN